MDFITIDFETATAQRDSACEVGLTFVSKGQITETKSWLIKPLYYPHFDYFNVAVHGIKPADVADAPEWPEVWAEIGPLLNNQFVIAHNAAFDMSVLRKTLESYRIPSPTLNYACSYLFSKNLWKDLPAYDLKTLCNMNGISFKHHRAASDAYACAELSLRALAFSGATCIEDFPDKLSTKVGQLFIGGYKPCQTKKPTARKIVKG